MYFLEFFQEIMQGKNLLIYKIKMDRNISINYIKDTKKEGLICNIKKVLKKYGTIDFHLNLFILSTYYLLHMYYFPYFSKTIRYHFYNKISSKMVCRFIDSRRGKYNLKTTTCIT